MSLLGWTSLLATRGQARSTGGRGSLSQEPPRAWVNIQTNTALFLFSPMEGGRFNLFMAFFFFFFCFPPPFFLLNQKGRVWFQEFRNSWLEELLVSDLLEFFSLTKQQVAFLTSTVLLPKQVSRLFATGKVRVSIWILANQDVRADSSFGFLNLLSLTAVFPCFH